MIVLGASLLAVGAIATAGIEWLWRKTQAARVLAGYPWRMRQAVLRKPADVVVDHLPMPLVKATRIRLDYERRLLIPRLVSVAVIIAGIDVSIVGGHAVAHPASVPAAAAVAVAALGGVIFFSSFAISLVRTNRKRLDLASAIEARERGF